MAAAVGVGVYLGASRCSVAVCSGDKLEVVCNAEGNRTTPCYVTFMEDSVAAGEASYQAAGRSPQSTVTHSVWLLGRQFDDADTQTVLKRLSCRTAKNPENGEVTFMLPNEADPEGGDKMVSCVDVVAALLGHVKSIISSAVGSSTSIPPVVLSMGATVASPSTQKAILEAAAKADITIVQIISMPLATAIAYGWDLPTEGVSDGAEGLTGSDVRVVFHMGGLTTSATLLQCNGGLLSEVSSVSILNGGAELDAALLTHFAQEASKKWRGVKASDILESKRSAWTLSKACGTAKQTLSTMAKITLEVDALYEGMDFSSSLTQPRFLDLAASTFQTSIQIFDSIQKPTEPSCIAVVGGCARIPKLATLVAGKSGTSVVPSAPLPCQSLGSDEISCGGAAIQAHTLLASRGWPGCVPPTAAALTALKAEMVKRTQEQCTTVTVIDTSIGVMFQESTHPDKTFTVISNGAPAPFHTSKSYAFMWDCDGAVWSVREISAEGVDEQECPSPTQASPPSPTFGSPSAPSAESVVVMRVMALNGSSSTTELKQVSIKMPATEIVTVEVTITIDEQGTMKMVTSAGKQGGSHHREDFELQLNPSSSSS